MSWNGISLILVLTNLAATTLHCLDNVLYFDSYPEPDWISHPAIVAALYLVAAALLVAGHVAFRRRLRWMSALCLLSFSVISAAALGHYLYAPMSSLTAKMNALILLETSAAVVLAGFVMVAQVFWQRLDEQAPEPGP